MTNARLMSWIGLLVLTVGIATGTAIAQKDPAKNPAPAARVGDEVITLEEVEQTVKPQLAKLEEQRYEILDQRLVLERLTRRARGHRLANACRHAFIPPENVACNARSSP